MGMDSLRGVLSVELRSYLGEAVNIRLKVVSNASTHTAETVTSPVAVDDEVPPLPEGLLLVSMGRGQEWESTVTFQ